MSWFWARAESKSTVTSTLIRQLGPFESLQSAQHLLDIYKACSVTCRYTIPKDLRSPINDVLEQAVADSVLAHPMLQAGLGGEDSKQPYWVRLDQIDLRNHIEWRTADEPEHDLTAILEEQHDAGFQRQDSQPPWRLVVVQYTRTPVLDIVMAWNHALGDGMALKVFHETLLDKLNQATSSKVITSPVLKGHCFDIPPTTWDTFPPPLEKLVEFPMTWAFMLSQAWTALKPPFLVSKTPDTATFAPIRLAPCKTRVDITSIEEDYLKRVLRACRAHCTSLTALLNVLAMISFSRRVPRDEATAFAAGTPIDLRRWIRPEVQQAHSLEADRLVLNLVTLWRYVFEEDVVARVRQWPQAHQSADLSTKNKEEIEESIWAMATEHKDLLTQRLAQGTSNDLLGLAHLAGDFRAFVRSAIQKPRLLAYGVSNLGVLDGRAAADVHKKNWSIERSFFSQSASVTGAAIVICPVAVEGRGLTITSVWQEGIVDDSVAWGVSSDLELWLTHLGQAGRLKLQQ